MKKRKARNTAVFALTALILVIAVLGPEQIARCKDKSRLGRVTVQETASAGSGYRYTLTGNERLYLLSESLSRQVLPESEASARTRAEGSEVDYGELVGSYAFVVNRQGPSGQEIADKEIFSICNQELKTLKAQKVLPQDIKEVGAGSYDAVLYSAIDVLEPQNNLSVWKVSLSTSLENADKAHRLIDAYIDADSGKIYSFYVRTERTWEELDSEEMAAAWSDYLELSGREDYTPASPLLETTPDYVTYRYPGIGEGYTVVTVGFYEGIQELFLKCW